MRTPAIASFLLSMLLLATAGCGFSDNTNPIPVPSGTVIEIYEVAATQGNNTKAAVDPESGKPIQLITPPLIATSDIDTIAQEENTDQPDHPMLKIDLTPAGEKKMVAATTTPTATHLALVVDGQIVSVPKIMVPIQDSMVLTGGNASSPAFEYAQKIFAGEK